MVGPARRTVAVGEALTLSVDVTDDGHPMPRNRPVRADRLAGPNGIDVPKPQSPLTQAVVKLDRGVRLGVTWVLYRGGPGTVNFNPMHVPVVSVGPPGVAPAAGPLSGKATTTATFSEAGTYQLRAYADDGVLATPVDVIVTVQASRPN
jgi:hypothetical protein